MIEQTLVLVKPDAVQRGLTGEILHRFEKAGLKTVALEMQWVDEEFAKRHYREDDIAARHGEEIWHNLLDLITEGPVVAAVLEGARAVENVRKICGPTQPKEAEPGTIRGDYAHHGYDVADAQDMAVRNVVHASATPEEAEIEIDVWFDDDDIHSYNRDDEYHHVGDQ